MPPLEYGSVKGIVTSISLTTNLINTKDGDIETYLAIIDFPNKLVTNYGNQLDFKFEIKGTAEIIVNERRLVHRFFDNLKYGIKK